MSSILKALRKLEEERATRRESSLDIARDILRRPPRRRASSTSRILAAGGILLTLGAGWGFFLWQHGSESILPKEPSTTRVGAVEPAGPPATLTPELAGRLSSVPAETQVLQEVVREIEIPAVTLRTPVATPATRQAGEEDAAPTGVDQTEPAPATMMGVPEVQETEPPGSAASVLPDSSGLVVTGIAFHNDPESRLAVVNDLPVMPGTVVGNAIVEEILPDRVRFSREGRTFEIGLQH